MRRPITRLRDQSINRLVPNMITVLAFCAGMTSIRFALQERWEAAVLAILIAGILDGLDGRVARMLNGASKFGAELDSLADFASFGVAPALLLYFWRMDSAGGIGWVIALMFAVCAALRLARFNTKLDNADLPAWTTRFFTGVPAPAGAWLALMPVFAMLEFGTGFFDRPLLVAAYTAMIGLLMISRIPTFSLKRLTIPHSWVLPTLLIVGLAAAFLVTNPWPTLLVIGAAYLASIPFSILTYRRLEREGAPVVVDEFEEVGPSKVQ